MTTPFQSDRTLFGLKVFIHPDRPKMKLAPGDYVTPAFRQEIDAWLVEFFGYTNLLEDGESIVSEQMGVVFVNPRGYAALRMLNLEYFDDYATAR